MGKFISLAVWGSGRNNSAFRGLLLIYVSSSMRYELDLLPFIAILDGFGFARGYEILLPFSKLCKLYVFVSMTLMLYT